MSRAILYSLIFLFLISFETSFLSSLYFLWYLVPVVPIVAIQLYHQHSSRIGLWYLFGWGIWHDYFSLSLWSSKTVIAIAMIIAVVYASKRIFSHQSVYGLIGTGFLSAIAWTVVEFIFRFFSPSNLGIAFDGFVKEQFAATIFLLAGLSAVFFISMRAKPRIQRWI